MELTFRPYEPGDEAAINASFNQAFGLGRDLDEWRWKFAEGPEGRWIIVGVDADGRVEAHYAAVPTRFQVDSYRFRAGQLVDSFTLAGVRQGLAAARAFLHAAETFFAAFGSPDKLAMMYGFPGERVFRLGMARLGYGEMPPQRVRVWVRAPAHGTRTWTGHSVRQGFDAAAVDDLWRRAGPRYPVAMVRDAAWLRRRFTGRPGVEYVHLSAWRRGGPAAWTVTRVQGATLACAELVWDGRRPGALAALDRALASRARQAGATAVEMWLVGDGRAAGILRELGWEEHDHPLGLRFGGRSFSPEVDMATIATRFYVTMADLDLV
jgi:hypothetical protein